ncbi:mitochondrial enolase superfamily member 1 [Grus japonensis]|uniref:Mitochondrial enolase superfamily member 1 n=1 Tax=Grus japonensis TaxID=30415 RepID=A0ABC9W595_GRUJA
MPAGSKMDPPLAKAKPISASVITYLRRKTKELKEVFCNQREEREDVRNSADTKPIKVPLDNNMTLWCISHSPESGVICKLAEGTLCPIIQIINGDVEQY